MTPRTPQCEVFQALLSSSEHSRVCRLLVLPFRCPWSLFVDCSSHCCSKVSEEQKSFSCRFHKNKPLSQISFEINFFPQLSLKPKISLYDLSLETFESLHLTIPPSSDACSLVCRNPTLAKSGGEAQHLEKVRIWIHGHLNGRQSLQHNFRPIFQLLVVAHNRILQNTQESWQSCYSPSKGK